MYTYPALLGLVCDETRKTISQQIDDPGHADKDAIVQADYGRPVYQMIEGTVGLDPFTLAVWCQAWLLPDSPLYRHPDLLKRILRHVAYAETALSPEGLWSNPSCNRHSPPDTGFAIDALLPVIAAARDTEDHDALAPLELLVRRMAEGMIGRGFHTPNHRWVVCGNLSLAMHLWPDLDARGYVDSILAETVDMNDDGEYIERSTGVYNQVSNHGLRLTARYLNRPDLYEPVRRNLEMMEYLFHDDWSTVTTFSGRQDSGKKVVPTGLAESFFTMGNLDGRGEWLAIADALVAHGAPSRNLFSLTGPFLLEPALRHSVAPRTAPHTDYTRHFPAARVGRIRRGPLSATLGAKTDKPFALRYGAVELSALKIAATYFGDGIFSADSLEYNSDDSTWVLHDPELHARHAPRYCLPLNRPVGYDDFATTMSERKTWPLPPMGMTLSVTEVADGFDLALKTLEGLPGASLQIECCFSGPGIWETDHTSFNVENGQTALLKTGEGIFHHEGWGISVGPGSAAHRIRAMRGTEPESGTFRVLLAYVTPAEPVVRIRFGRWSAARGLHSHEI